MTKSFNKPMHRLALLMAVIALAAAGLPGLAAAAEFHVTSAECDGPGTFRGEVEAAEATPGHDTVIVDPSLERIDITQCGPTLFNGNYGGTPLWNFSYVYVSDDLTIDGNGVLIEGNIEWVSYTGARNPERCIDLRAGDIPLSETPGLITVGTPYKDYTPISVTVKNLKIKKLHHVAYVFADSSLTLEDFEATEVKNIRNCRSPVLETQVGSDGSLILRRNRWADITAEAAEGDPLEYPSWIASDGVISGNGTLIIEDSQFLGLFGGQFGILWYSGFDSAGALDVVSSTFLDAGGIRASGDITTNFVNSVWVNIAKDEEGKDPGERFIQQSTGPMNFINSTVLFPGDPFLEYGLRDTQPFPALESIGGIVIVPNKNGTGAINFRGSAIGTNRAWSTGLLLDSRMDPSGSTFTADEYTFIGEILGPDYVEGDPTSAVQSAAALRALTGQPLLWSDDNAPDALPGKEGVFLGTESLALAVPAQGSALIDAIPDVCEADGASSTLLNPVDGSPIPADVTGNPRCEELGDDDFRNIGALQVTFAPHLESVRSPDGGDGDLDLAWTRPFDRPFPQPAYTAYDACYGTGAPPDPAEITGCPQYLVTAITGIEKTTARLSGLTNGTEYWVIVRGNSGGNPGPWSNVRTGTPYGPVESPAPLSAQPGDREVLLTWTQPDLGGRQFTGYSVIWTLAGSEEIVGATAVFGYDKLFTTITGLTNGTRYAFKVTANAGSAFSEQAIAEATPHGDVGTVDRSPDYSQPATVKANNPRYWENLGYGSCTKYEVRDGFGSVWTLDGPASALILKSDTTNDVWKDPVAHLYGPASAKDISHAIVCW